MFEAQKTVTKETSSLPQPASKSESPSSSWTDRLKVPLNRLAELGGKELFLKPPAVKEAHDQNNRSLSTTIFDSFKIVRQNSPNALLGRGAFAAAMASFPLASAWLVGKLVGSVTDYNTATLSLVAGLCTAVGYSVIQDGIVRVSILFSSWEQRGNVRLTSKLAAAVTGTWTYEELEDGKNQLAYERFYRNASKMYEVIRSSLDGLAITISAATSAVLIAALDWRVSALSLVFIAVRGFRDVKEAKVAFAIEKQASDPRRTLGVKEDVSSRPTRLRDVRFVDKNDQLQTEYQNGSAKIDRGELSNEVRVQTINLSTTLFLPGLSRHRLRHLASALSKEH